MIWKNKKRSITAFFALSALILNALLPFFASYSSGGSYNDSSIFSEKILICTADGFKWVNFNELQEHKDKQNPQSRFKCPLCYVAAQHIKYVSISKVSEVAYFSYQLPIVYYSEYKYLEKQHSDNKRITRAPPIFIIA